MQLLVATFCIIVMYKERMIPYIILFAFSGSDSNRIVFESGKNNPGFDITTETSQI